MALTATFAADFDRFLGSIEKAQVHLRVFDRETKNASRSVSRELESISGQKVAAEAARMAEAVKRLGGEGGTAAGLLKLTDSELSRLQTTLATATDKAHRLGEELPASLKDVNAEISKLPKPVEASANGFASLGTAFTQMTSAFTAGALLTKAITGIAELGREAFASAGNLVDLRAATGSSLEMLQRWTHVAEQGGVELEVMTAAAFKLGTKLDGGSDSVRASVEALGLSFANLRTAKDPLDEVLKASDALGPSQQRNTALVQLFGTKSATQLAKVAEGYRETAAAAAVASDRSIEALDRASDKFVAAMRRARVEMQGFLGEALENMSSAAGGFQDFSEDQRRQIGAVLAADQDPSRLLAKFREENERAAEASRALQAAQATVTAGLVPYAANLAKAQSEIAALSAADRAELDAARALGDGFEAVAERLGLSEDAQHIYGTAVRETAKDLREASAATAEYADSLRELSGLSALDDAKLAERQLQGVGGTAKVVASRLDTLRKRFEEGAAAAQHLGDADLAEFYRGVARELDPIVQLQQRYNVTIGDFAPIGADFTDVIRDQVEVLTGLQETIYFGVLPNLMDLARAMEGFKGAAVENAPDGSSFFERMQSVVGGIAEELDKSANAFQRLAQVAGRGMGRVAEAITIAATALRDFNDVLTNMAEGDKAGAIMAGIRLGVNLAASLWDGLTNSAGERAAAEVGRDMGVRITEAMGDAIAATARDLFRGDRFSAAMFHLDDIIAADGGLNAANLDKMISRLRDVFSLVQTGAFTSAQAVQVLDKNWQAFVDAGTNASGRLAPALTEIIRLTRELGIESKAIRDYQIGQSNAAIAGINAVINASKSEFDSYQKIASAVKDAQAAVDALNKVEERGRGVEWQREMAAAQAALTKGLSDQHAASEAAAGELENLGRIAMGVYAAAIEAGMTHNQAIQAAGPGLTQLMQAYENLGLSVEDAGLKAFLAQAKFVQQNPEILAGIDGLAQAMTAMSNIGLLNADTFAQMQAAGLRMYERLLAEAGKFGLEGDEAARAALLPMQEYLRQAAEQAELLGIPLDETTQKLIDQSKSLGIWKDKGKDPLVEMRDAVLEMRDAVKELTDALKGIPPRVTSDVTTRYHSEGQPPGPSPGSTPGPTPGPSPATVAAATSTRGRSGEIRVPVYLDGRQIAIASAPHQQAANRWWGVT